MKLSPEIKRSPDILVVTAHNTEKLKPTRLDGAADLAIEVVSAGSIERDRGDKFKEYEVAGVREYWIIDPIHKGNLFYVMAEDGTYRPKPVDEMGICTSKQVKEMLEK